MNKLLAQTGRFLKRNGSTILTFVGGAGVVATSVMAVKATPKALQLLEEAKQEKGEELTKLEVVKVAAPTYIPSVVIGLSTLTCIFGANYLNKRQQAALTSAYMLLSNSYKEYKQKIEDMYGEAVNTRVHEEIALDKYEEKDEEIEVEDDKILFYDYFSDRYFASTIEDVQRAEYRINRDMAMRGYVYLNEFYEHLDIEPIEAGYALGWSEGSQLATNWQNWIDFTHEKAIFEDGLECHIIVMDEPLPDFMEYS